MPGPSSMTRRETHCGDWRAWLPGGGPGFGAQLDADGAAGASEWKRPGDSDGVLSHERDTCPNTRRVGEIRRAFFVP